jgi:hypothetical protein
MAGRRSKTGILARLRAKREELERLLATLGPERMLEAGVVARSSVKDVLAHLADWEEHMSIWLETARRGDPVPGPEPGLTWRQLAHFNERIHEAHRDQPLGEVLDYFHAAHARFMERVVAMPEEEMLARGRYPFLERQALYDWLVAYADHDAWGARRIREWLVAREAATATAAPGA